MKKLIFILIVTLILVVLNSGCSQSSGPSDPGSETIRNITESTSEGSRSLWSAFDIEIDVENMTAEVEQISRDLAAHYNVSTMVLPPKCADCLVIEVTNYDPVKKIASVTVTLKNPSSVTGYDVRAVVLDYDSKEFLDTNGYTTLWAQSGRNPFYNFAINDPQRIFGPGESHSRDIEIHMGSGATGNATVVVDASWPAQCADPYEIYAATSSWLINDADDNTKIVAYIFDHQNDIQNVACDLTPLGGALVNMLDDGNSGDGDAGDGIFGYKGITTTVPHGDYDIWINAKSVGSEIYTWQKVIVTVSDIDPYRGGDPDYDRMYDTSEVHRIDITISPENWTALQADLDEQIQLPWDQIDFSYFECDVEFEGLEWKHAGFRYKGNSSINSTYNQGIEKLPFKLDFDEFEDTWPETNNQRIYGLKMMIFNNNFKDPSMLREIVTYELFNDFGALGSRASHYAIFLDHGEGSTYWGLYTSVERVDERWLDDRFEDGNGNLYKPAGSGADLTYFNEYAFVKKTNEDEEDWSDVINFIDVLNDSYGSAAQFQTALEEVLDIDTFLNWLVVNSVTVNIDSYAAMAHNYYLYNNPIDGKFYFIPWDVNEAFGSFMLPGYNVTNIHTWDILDPTGGGPHPLIENVLNVPAYMDEYKLRCKNFINTLFIESALNPRFDTLNAIGEPYVVGADGEFPPYTLLFFQEEFNDNLDVDVPPMGPQATPGLKPFVTNRRNYINSVIP